MPDIQSEWFFDTYQKSLSNYIESSNSFLDVVITTKSGTEPIKIQDFLNAVIDTKIPILLLGNSGAGKTTLSLALLDNILKKNRKSILIKSRYLEKNNDILDGISLSILEIMQTYLKKEGFIIKYDDLKNFINNLLESQQLYLIFDGLNEAPSMQQIEAIGRLCLKYYWHTYILTNRVENKDILSFLGNQNFRTFYLEGLHENSIRQYIIMTDSLTQNQKNNFTSLIDKNPRFRLLLKNPQKLKISCVYYGRNEELSNSLGKVFFDTLYQTKSELSKLNLNVTIKLLSNIAAEMNFRRVVSIRDILYGESGSDSISLLLDKILDSDSEVKRQIPIQLIDDKSLLIEALCTSFFIRDTINTYSFIHQSYQELFGALWFIANFPLFSDGDIEKIVVHPNWKGSVIFSIGLFDKKEDLRKLFEVMMKYSDSILLAAECINEISNDNEKEIITIRLRSTLFDLFEMSKTIGYKRNIIDKFFKLGFYEDVKELVDICLKSDEWLLKETAALYSGDIKYDNPEIVNLLADSNLWVRAAAVWALGEFCETKYLDHINAFLKTEKNYIDMRWGLFAKNKIEGKYGNFSKSSFVRWWQDFFDKKLIHDFRTKPILSTD